MLIVKREQIGLDIMNKCNEQHGGQERHTDYRHRERFVPLVGQVLPRFHAGHISFRSLVKSTRDETQSFIPRARKNRLSCICHIFICSIQTDKCVTA